ncbi:hypothetical protein XELAEV_18001340mg [Xenopus laevis]|nr:hypothetical protein XELAEV_18001340mg [Xenopus laevis]
MRKTTRRHACAKLRACTQTHLKQKLPEPVRETQDRARELDVPSQRFDGLFPALEPSQRILGAPPLTPLSLPPGPALGFGQITQLKIQTNPFAKGFREDGMKSKRDRSIRGKRKVISVEQEQEEEEQFQPEGECKRPPLYSGPCDSTLSEELDIGRSLGIPSPNCSFHPITPPTQTPPSTETPNPSLPANQEQGAPLQMSSQTPGTFLQTYPEPPRGASSLYSCLEHKGCSYTAYCTEGTNTAASIHDVIFPSSPTDAAQNQTLRPSAQRLPPGYQESPHISHSQGELKIYGTEMGPPGNFNPPSCAVTPSVRLSDEPMGRGFSMNFPHFLPNNKIGLQISGAQLQRMYNGGGWM